MTHSIQNPEHCPTCLDQGIPVPGDVMKSMLPREHPHRGQAGFRFCPNGSCPTAYFQDEAVIDKSELNKLVTLKDPSPEAPVCYCLNVSRGTIFEGIQDGTIQSSEDAKRVTKACTGKACHIVNPGGICCGDQLRDTVVTGLKATNAAPELIQHAKQEDPGSTCCGRTLAKVLDGEAEDGCCAAACGI